MKSISLLKPMAEQKVSASTPRDKVNKKESAVVPPCIATDCLRRAGAQLPITTYIVYTQRDLEIR